MPRLEEDSAAGAGRVATRRLDADDRDRIGTVRSILTSAPRDRIGGGTPPRIASVEAAFSAESWIRRAGAERGLTPGPVGLADTKAEDEPREKPPLRNL